MIKQFQNLLGMSCFSDKLLQNHFNMYREHVQNLNRVLSRLEELSAGGGEETAEFAALQRRKQWESEALRLHELYFENLSGAVCGQESGKLTEKLVEHFGSFDTWKADFVATALMPGTGWAVLYMDNNTGNINNLWLDEQQHGLPDGGTPLFVLDAWEHAYMLDYGMKREEYIHSVLDHVNWPVVEKRLCS
jgi:Fe-Mn family superoxide dismutase